MIRATLSQKLGVWTASALILAAFFILYGSYFPAKNGTVGDDYQQQLPNLLTSYYWFLENGFFSVPWFAPAQCGGVPFFADPGHGFFALPTYLVLFFNPVLSIKITFILFSLLGYAGFYFLLRNAFWVSRPLAVAGAALFALNGFYAYRMIVGHPFHAFMLVPFIALLAISRRPAFLLKIVIVGFLFAYMFHSAMIHIIPPAFLALIVIILIHQTRHGFNVRSWAHIGLGAIVGAGLSLSKISASLSLLRNFPRDFYTLPGFPRIFDSARIAFESVFLRVPTDTANNLLANAPFYLQQHEFEFGITPVPFVLMTAGIIFFIATRIKKQEMPPMKKIVSAFAISLLLAIPILLNWYSPTWNSFLKKLPWIGQSSSLIRWFSAYIPVFVLLGILAAESLSKKHAVQIAIAALSVVFAIGYHTSADRAYYDSQHYNPETIQTAYRKAKQTRVIPDIKAVGVYTKQNGEIAMPIGRNDVFTQGGSQLACYNALFGYRLEKFPRKDLIPGPVLSIRNGHFNIKNPACYVFPAENNCAPGDHFREEEREKAEAFVHYKPFEFQKSSLQKSADAINIFFLLFCLGVVVREIKRLFPQSYALRKQR
ncbi:MAG: hypothetical protein A3F26_03450 [Candidatus Ryanbacteria bacterium RIFCSPHIGHO2_12_FULL_47_12b]|nr:MAG: hypothetical protein UX74_C0022G0010 [Parcubacteria group bacterium GW2011_GWA2_47_10b]OGZ46038.1 MAG: hypothetical protein A2844_02485 [Candidatus Ryanbacteria bacterium RIFCSPHIGHO2_01_FULL_48_80]OGZ48875.1 MAG: hypothetical protein A3C83_01355 [Candidatus Ryanbacteria bacterium RIFCSPHIGHO2_02_FULL_47_25]OGZ53067.1 MAG: hypothetical protein A3F26_03450 [Candidatus Ryanbacteria bacterium RIFCSPHIGHO2_12_FULL_47_12b]